MDTKIKKVIDINLWKIVVGHEKIIYEEKIFSRNVMEHRCLEYEKNKLTFHFYFHVSVEKLFSQIKLRK